MAESFSEIMNKYKDMSVAELGSSLLQRKEEKDRKAAKSMRKSERIQQALGVLLAGQAVFKGALNRRTAELDAAYEFEKANNDYQAKEINLASKLTQPIYQWAETVKDKKWASNEEKYEAFINSEHFAPFKTAVDQYTEPAFKAGLGDLYNDYSTKTGYYTAQVEAAKNYAREYLQDDKYTKVVSTLKELFDVPAGQVDFDAVDLFKKGMGLESHDLTAIEARDYKRILNQYKNDGNIFSGIKQVFDYFTDKNVREGGLPIFRNIDETMLMGPRIDQVLDGLNFKGLTNQFVNKEIVKLNRSSVRADALFTSARYQTLRDSLPSYLNTLNERINQEEFQLYDMLSAKGMENIISISDFDDLFDQLDDTDKQILMRDGGKLSILLDPNNPDNEKFLRGLFESNHRGVDKDKDGKPDISFEQFKELLSNETFRVHYGMTLAATEGMKDFGLGLGYSTWDGDTRYSPTTDVPKSVYLKYQREQGMIPELLGENIILPTKDNRNYGVGANWNKLSKDAQIAAINTQVLAIQKKDVTEKQKELELNNLFYYVPHPNNLTWEQHIATEQYQNYVESFLNPNPNDKDDKEKTTLEDMQTTMENILNQQDYITE